jgi:Protein of unknown function (DUF5131)
MQPHSYWACFIRNDSETRSDCLRCRFRQVALEIQGGESGPGARPLKPDWVRELRDRCQRENVAFFFKQWGGVLKSRTGRTLDGATWNEMPVQITAAPKHRSSQPRPDGAITVA